MHFSSATIRLYARSRNGAKQIQHQEVALTGWTSSRTDGQSIPSFTVVFPSSSDVKTYTQTLYVEFSLRNVGTGGKDKSTYMYTKDGLILQDGGDFKVNNVLVEQYDPQKRYDWSQNTIILFGKENEPFQCVINGDLGKVWRISYDGQKIYEIIQAPMGLDGSKSVKASSILTERDAEICLKQVFPSIEQLRRMG
ncbi:hypothetical protein RF11_14965 [Thelohanellus kitauei]|uniref:Uncharacterized protein n=1 Tax=Thelohanellus kitauei TaxID=669202 RepID=A0A0C2N379_THEKT|nr:hypothetical protein RF11_14965 [Thelohanellus kitauei]